MPTPKAIRDLVKRYDNQRDLLRSNKPQQEQFRKQFIGTFFRALSWDKPGIADGTGNDVVREHDFKQNAETKAPDYSVRVKGVRKFFVRVPGPSLDIENDPDPAYQIRRYAWSAKVPLSIVSDFRALAVYDGRVRPSSIDTPEMARIHCFKYTEYEQHWDDIASIFSKDAVLAGNLDSFAEKHPIQGGTAEVDDAFLAEIEVWREQLARNIAVRNPALGSHDLNFAVQQTINRIIFLRICEDRGIEPYGQLRNIREGEGVYRRLMGLFRQADVRYNSGLFHLTEKSGRLGEPDGLTQGLVVDDEPLKAIFGGLYYPESPYEFSVIGADILGQIYERFLGKVVRIGPERTTLVEDKPEVRKAGGVYYTPTYIVDEIVQHTVAKLCEGKTREDVAGIKVLDPACGSGSFLNGAYQYLLDWHRDWYLAHEPKRYSSQIKRRGQGRWDLTLEERNRILLSNIYGVDIDAQAVEVTKLSLLLKALEGEGQELARNQLVLVRKHALPDLDSNIKCGNSLIEPDFYDSEQAMLVRGEDERRAINVFDWKRAFPGVFGSGASGFDAVIGNPPYLSYAGRQAVELPPGVREYFSSRYEYLSPRHQGKKWPASHSLFMEKSVRLLSKQFVSYIVPDQVGHLDMYGSIRDLALRHAGLVNVHYRGEHVFKGVITPALTFVLNKTVRPVTNIINADGTSFEHAIRPGDDWTAPAVIVPALKGILEKVAERSFSLKPYLADCGFRTTRATSQVVPLSEASGNHLPVLEGKQVHSYQCDPPKKAVLLDIDEPMVGNREKQRDALFLIRQTAHHPIVGPHAHVPHFRNTVFALYSPSDGHHVNYLVGLLNSRLLRFVYSATVRESHQRAFPQVKIRTLSKLPIRSIDFADATERARHDELVVLVASMLELSRKRGAKQTQPEQALVQQLQQQMTATERRIDALVYDIYGLTNDEIATVEQTDAAQTVDVAEPTAGELEADEEDMQPAVDAEPEPWYPPKTPGELWEIAASSTTAFDQRIACLYELVDAEDPGLPRFLTTQLQREYLRRDEQRALVLAAERTQILDDALRVSLKDSLFRHGIVMRDLGEEGPLWAAIRRYASLVPLTEVDGLLEFLRPGETDATQQAALQGIQHIFEVELPDDSASVSRLRERVAVLALEYLTPESTGSPEGSSLALNAFCAAASLGDWGLGTLTERLICLGRARLASRARLFLHALARARETSTGARADELRKMLSENIRRIDEAETAFWSMDASSRATGGFP